jgi:hypothetical protein
MNTEAKRMGRPSLGQRANVLTIPVRMSPELVDAIDQEATGRLEPVSRNQAIRELIKEALIARGERRKAKP